MGKRKGLIILPKDLKHNPPGQGPINYDVDDDNDDDDDDDDDNDDFDVFSWYQRTSNTICTMNRPIEYDDDNESDDDDDDDDNDNNENDDNGDDAFSKKKNL